MIYHNLVDFEIKQLTEGEDPAITSSDKILDANIKSNSLDATVDEDVFWLDPSIAGITAQRDKTFYELLKDAGSKAKRMKLNGDLEFKVGRSYAIHLNEKITPGHPAFKRVKNSQKSTFGRMFWDQRFHADYNPSTDEINEEYMTGRALDMWLVIEPLTFDTILHPGTPVTQLRFFPGPDYIMSDSEVREEIKVNPMLYLPNGEELEETEHIVANGLQMHLDLSGKNKGGVVALRAQSAHDPVDTAKVAYYDIEEYFEPISSKKIKVRAGEHYIMVSKEVLRMTLNTSAELNMTSHIGPQGFLHRAGFIDSPFKGQLVFEYSPTKGLTLVDGMPMGRLLIFRNKTPVTPYAGNYQGQEGPKPAKFFDYEGWLKRVA